MLKAMKIPELRALGGPPLYLRNLSVGTVGGSHLGVFVDVATTQHANAVPGVCDLGRIGPGRLTGRGHRRGEPERDPGDHVHTDVALDAHRLVDRPRPLPVARGR